MFVINEGNGSFGVRCLFSSAKEGIKKTHSYTTSNSLEFLTVGGRLAKSHPPMSYFSTQHFSPPYYSASVSTQICEPSKK